MLSSRVRQVAVVATLLLMLFHNLGLDAHATDLAAAGQRGMYAQNPNAFAPHPFSFAIWLPIFLGAIAFALFQALPRNRAHVALDRVGTRLVAGYGLAALTAVVGLPISNIVVTLALVAMAAALYAARTLDDGAGRWLVRAPLGLFTGWLVVATTLNLCQLLTNQGLTIDARPAALLMLGVALAGQDIVRRSGEPAVAIAIIWAFGGIIAAHPGDGLLWAAAGSGLLVLATRLRADLSPVPAAADRHISYR